MAKVKGGVYGFWLIPLVYLIYMLENCIVAFSSYRPCFTYFFFFWGGGPSDAEPYIYILSAL